MVIDLPFLLFFLLFQWVLYFMISKDNWLGSGILILTHRLWQRIGPVKKEVGGGGG